MQIESTLNITELAAASTPRNAKTEEAATEFERVLVKQFVQTMTKDLFADTLAGSDGPSWMGAYGDLQRDALTDVLTDHLVASGSMRLRDFLLRQWGHSGIEAASPMHPDTD